jgi:predicted RNA-binding Zn-ribbon protein involved in translation (DUF1610 family)
MPENESDTVPAFSVVDGKITVEWIDHPQLRRRIIQSVRITWPCPKDACGGQMIASGFVYAESQRQGRLHTCSACGFTAGAPGSYPRAETDVSLGDVSRERRVEALTKHIVGKWASAANPMTLVGPHATEIEWSRARHQAEVFVDHYLLMKELESGGAQ